MANTHPASEIDELLTSSTFGTIAGVTPDTVRTWRRKGTLQPAFQTTSGISLYRRADAERIARERVERQTRRQLQQQHP